MSERRLPRIIELEPTYAAGRSTRQFAVLMGVFCVLYAAGLAVIILHWAGVIS